MRSRITAGLMTTVLVVGAFLAMPGSAEAAPVASRPYDVTYGATYSRGTLYWYNRSATVVGIQRSVSTSPGGCRKTWAMTFTSEFQELDERTTTPVCGGSSNITIPLNADVPGGAAWIEICLMNELGAFLDESACTFYKKPATTS